MAINQLQLPGPLVPPQVDFSALGSLPAEYKRAQIESARKQALADLPRLPDGSLDFNTAAAKLAQVGDMQGAQTFAQLGMAQANQSLDRTYKLGTLDLARRAAEGEKVPAGFERNPAGGLRPIAGGAADPDYIKKVNEAKDKGRQFNAGEITKLTEEGGKYQNLSGFATTFQDRFAGRPVIGGLANTAGRYLPEGVVGKDIAEGAAWWQQYDRYKNVVRNDLFGSALTANEQAAFEKADINPGMTPEQIRKNLDEQKKIVAGGMKRKASALVASGYDPAPIAQAYGIPLAELGVTATKRGQGPSPANDALSQAREAIAKGADRDAVIKRLRENNIDPSGL